MVNCVHVYHRHVFKSSLLHVAFKMVEGQPWELSGSLGEDKLMREVGVHLSNEGGLWPLGCTKILYLKGRSKEEKCGPLEWQSEFPRRRSLNSPSSFGGHWLIPWPASAPRADRGALLGPPQWGRTWQSGRAQLRPWMLGKSGTEVQLTPLLRSPHAWAFPPQTWVTRALHWPSGFTGHVRVSLLFIWASCRI